ncbi:MAG: alpha-2-macroglobulin family protein, partial [Desulfobacterales bacterium]
MRCRDTLFLVGLIIILLPPFMNHAITPTAGAGSSSLRIVRITPDGVDVPPGRQIVFQFDRPVVPVGRMQRSDSEIPISITPKLDCQWRWINTSALTCQLNEKSALSPATRYDLVVKADIRTQDGTALSHPVRHSFTTERPTVKYAQFKTWKSPGTPFIRVNFNQPVFQDSVAQHLHMRLADANDQGVLLNVIPDPDLRDTPFILPVPGEKYSLITKAERSLTQEKAAGEDGQPGRETEARKVWLISPQNELPLNVKVDLIVTPGLVSFYGPESGAEDRIVVSFHTFPAFDFLGIECTDNYEHGVFIEPGIEDDQAIRCDPLRRLALVFTAPVINEEVKNHVKISPDLAGGRTDYDPWANYRGYSRLRSPHQKDQKYRVWLPETLKAFQEYDLRSAPGNLRDEFGRTLPRPIHMSFATDHRRPDFTLTHRKAILEKEIESEMPLVVTNLDSVKVIYDMLTTSGKMTAQMRIFNLPKAEDISFRTPLEIREILRNQTGVVLGSLHSSPGVAKNKWERWFFAQVTPFQVHVKFGHFNTLVWVTDFANGQPVSGATVQIFRDTYTDLSLKPKILSQDKTDSDGVAVLGGTLELDPQLEFLQIHNLTDPRLFVRVEKAGDLALLPLEFDFRVDTYRASRFSVFPYLHRQYGHLHAWGTTAQGVYRAGDVIQYKLYVRDQNNETLVPAPRQGYDLKVVDPMGKTVHEMKNITLSEFGAHDGEFMVPENGAVGWYRFQLASNFFKDTKEPMRVLVSDFTPSPFKVTTDLNGERFQPGDKLEVTTRARLHAGGPYVEAQSRITATLQIQGFRSDHPEARGFGFNVNVPGGHQKQILHQTEGMVGNQGTLITRFSILESDILYGKLVAESAVRDDRGKYISARASADYAARNRFVGLRRSSWVLKEDEPAAVDALVVNDAGVPVAGVPVAIAVERQVTKAARVKGAGNAYLTRYTHQWVQSADCELTSGDIPVTCNFTPSDPGSFRITASVRDTRNRIHSSQIYQWVAGKGRVVWQERPDNSLEIVAEKPSYAVGETARYLVKNPFPGAQALITIERYGVIQRWIQTLEGSTPMIEFEVKPDFLPGYFLSVVVVSPRVEAPPADSQVDLGKPAFRMGYVKVPVVDPFKALAVTVFSEHDTYKPRERVKVQIRATPRHGTNHGKIELAVAVLDESVLDLISRGLDYFDPYKGFYKLDGLDLTNYSLLMRLVGRQKFEKKGADAGGGGGLDISLRSVFKFVSYWNPSITANAAGRATIEFNAPDNLTGWRVLVMAVTPGDRMGLGDGRFKVNRPTEIRPVMPNQVTETDSFQAGFSIMNRTPSARDLSVSLAAEGVIETEPGKKILHVTRMVSAEPYKRTTIWLPLQTTRDGTIHLTARAGDDLDQDGMTHIIPVEKRYSIETAATYGTTDSDSASESFLIPQNIRTDVGSVSMVVSPSIISNLEGAFRYIQDYPYICWEQILTQGVMASHYQNLKEYMANDVHWDQSQRLTASMLQRAATYQAPNGGMTYYIPLDRYVSPYLSAYTAIAFNWLRESGYKIPLVVEEKLHDYLLTLLRRNVVPDFYSKGMASTVRAVALAALVKHGKADLSDLRRYHRHVPQMSLFGKAHYLMAAVNVTGAETLRSYVFDLILAHGYQTGGKFIFSETIDDSYSRILSSALRTNGAVLSALIAYRQLHENKQSIGDIPFRLVRYITQTRKNRDHWENTQENMFCMNALVDYSRIYESESPDMQLRVLLDDVELGQTSFNDLRDPAVEFRR